MEYNYSRQSTGNDNIGCNDPGPSTSVHEMYIHGWKDEELPKD
jgi:hypothetical protein